MAPVPLAILQRIGALASTGAGRAEAVDTARDSPYTRAISAIGVRPAVEFSTEVVKIRTYLVPILWIPAASIPKLGPKAVVALCGRVRR